MKADKFAAEDDKGLRSKAKQAILQELNTQFQVKAEKIRLRNRNDAEGYDGMVQDDEVNKRYLETGDGIDLGPMPMGR